MLESGHDDLQLSPWHALWLEQSSPRESQDLLSLSIQASLHWRAFPALHPPCPHALSFWNLDVGWLVGLWVGSCLPARLHVRVGTESHTFPIVSWDVEQAQCLEGTQQILCSSGTAASSWPGRVAGGWGRWSPGLLSLMFGSDGPLTEERPGAMQCPENLLLLALAKHSFDGWPRLGHLTLSSGHAQGPDAGGRCLGEAASACQDEAERPQLC